jgi:transglutaminase-like putative cysteine protease
VTDSPTTARSITYRVVHRTTYEYEGEVVDGYTVANLLPRHSARQRVELSSLVAEPEPDEYDEHDDVFGNRVVQLGLHHPHDRFQVTAISDVEVVPDDVPSDSMPWDDVVVAARQPSEATSLVVVPFLAITPLVDRAGAAIDEFFDEQFVPGRPIVDVARAVCSGIYRGFEFDPAATDVSTPLADVVSSRRGVCQDFAHLAIAAFRRRGLPARYVSGYIETEPPPGEPKSIGADASHAWCSLWVPDHGWVDLDPTNDQVPTTRHVTVAWGRDYADIAPVRGVVIGPATGQRLDVSVDVTRL